MTSRLIAYALQIDIKYHFHVTDTISCYNEKIKHTLNVPSPNTVSIVWPCIRELSTQGPDSI